MRTDRRQLFGMASLYEQIIREVYDRRGPSELQPAQWAALRFFGRAGEDARTVSGLAAFLGVTMGPASRSAAALDRRGLITSAKNPNDARSVLFTITDAGQKKLTEDPLFKLVDAISGLDQTERQVLSNAIVKITEHLTENRPEP